MSQWNGARMMLTSTKPSSSFVSQMINQFEAASLHYQQSQVVGAISLLALGLLVKAMLQRISTSSVTTTDKQMNRNTYEESRSPYGKSQTYNAELATEYFKKRPLMVLARSLTIIITSMYFYCLLWKDKWMGKLLGWSNAKLAKQEAKRADQLADLLSRTGGSHTTIEQ